MLRRIAKAVDGGQDVGHRRDKVGFAWSFCEDRTWFWIWSTRENSGFGRSLLKYVISISFYHGTSNANEPLNVTEWQDRWQVVCLWVDTEKNTNFFFVNSFNWVYLLFTRALCTISDLIPPNSACRSYWSYNMIYSP